MRHIGRTLLPALLGSLALVGLASASTTDKVTICHFPPGNPANYQTITISASALPAHLAHHDFGGPCANDCNLFGSICNDGNACTTDTCNPDGTCSISAPRNCDDGNPCTTDSCDPTTGECVNTPTPGVTCNDGNDCTYPDQCDSDGRCQGTTIPNCCTTSADCDDGDPCTIDACTNERCSNTPVDCTGGPDPCQVGACQDGSCVLVPTACPAGAVCSYFDGHCTAATCPTTPYGDPTACETYAAGLPPHPYNDCLECVTTYDTNPADVPPPLLMACDRASSGGAPGGCQDQGLNSICTEEVNAAGCAAYCCP